MLEGKSRGTHKLQGVKLLDCRWEKLLTPQPCFWHVVCLVMDPLGAVRADVGLRGSVGHRVIADPGCQVDVESIWVNDSICIHKTLLSQLQNGKKLEAFQNKFCL